MSGECGVFDCIGGVLWNQIGFLKVEYKILPFTNTISSNGKYSKWRKYLYESNRYCEKDRLMRYNRTRLRKPHKHWVFADFVQTESIGNPAAD